MADDGDDSKHHACVEKMSKLRTERMRKKGKKGRNEIMEGVKLCDTPAK